MGDLLGQTTATLQICQYEEWRSLDIDVPTLLNSAHVAISGSKAALKEPGTELGTKLRGQEVSGLRF